MKIICHSDLILLCFEYKSRQLGSTNTTKKQMKYTSILLLIALLAVAFCQSPSTAHPTDSRGCWLCPDGWQHWYELGYAEPSNGDKCQCLNSANTAGPTTTTTTEAPYVFDYNQICPQRHLVGLGKNCTLTGGLYCAASQVCSASGDIYTCQAPSSPGDSCSGQCINSPLFPGSKLECISSKCAFSGKRNGDSCGDAKECSSGRCESGKCAENWVGGSCAKDTDCQPNSSCDVPSGKCVDTANFNEPCGLVKAGSSAIQCKGGFSCVGNVTSSTSGFCVSSAKVGETCSDDGGSVYSAPHCLDSSNKCSNGKCVAAQGGQIGDKCDVSGPCMSTLTCFQGVCTNPNSVPCDMKNNTNCASNQYCSCNANNADATGTCAVDTSDPRSVTTCNAQIAALQLCISTYCSVQPAFYPFDGYSCVAEQNCKSKISDLMCCQKGLLGSAFIAPAQMDVSVCGGGSITPTSAQSSTATPTKTNSPAPVSTIPQSRNSAAREMISSLLLISLIVFASL
jgi:hypothetical protein